MKLKTAQIDELTRLCNEDEAQPSRASNRQKAIDRLQKKLAARLNDNDGFFNSLLGLDPNDEEAFEAVRLDLCDELGKDRPVPLPKDDVDERKTVAEGDTSPDDGSQPSVARTKKPRGMFSGKHIWPLKRNPDGVGYHNTRRFGTHGYNSMQIVIGQPGVLYEDYIKQGGRRQDLQWDIDHGNATVRDAVE